MSTKPNRFGIIAIGMEYLSEEQLNHALSRQQQFDRRGTPHRRLGEICIDLGYLTTDQIETVMERIRVLSLPFLSPQVKKPTTGPKDPQFQADTFLRRSTDYIEEPSPEENRTDGITLQEAARQLRVSESEIRSKIIHGELEAWRIPGAEGMEWRVAIPVSAEVDTPPSTKPLQTQGTSYQASTPPLSPTPQIAAAHPGNPVSARVDEDTVPGAFYRELLQRYESTLELTNGLMRQVEYLSQREAQAVARVAELEQKLKETP